MIRGQRIHAGTGIRTVLTRAAALVALACPLYYVIAFVYIALSRIRYPFALEWLEGGSYAQVQRVLTGQPLYARPGMDYVAMIYPPLYYYAAALLSRATGFSFLSMRLISFASVLGMLLVIFLIVRQEGTRLLPAALGSGLFAATYWLSGSWFDIARVDMLSVFLVVLAVFLLRLPQWTSHFAAGLTLALACLTKQTHLITLAGMTVYLVLIDRKKLAPFLGPCLSVLVAACLILNRVYEGWFGFFVLKLAAGSGEYVTFEPATFMQTASEFWLRSILLPLPFVVLCVLAFVIAKLRMGGDRAGLFFYLACAAGMIGTSWAVTQVGGYRNDLLPAYASIAMLFGISLQWLMGRAAEGATWVGGLLLACILQFVLLWYPIAPQIPSQEDLTAGNALLKRIHEQRGEIYVPFHPELALMAGKTPFASWSPMFQLEGNYGGGDIRATGRVKTEFARAMQRRQFTMIILDQESNWIWGDPERYYARSSEPVFADEDVFWPVTGWQTRPEFILLPLED
jgi:hypothetical protein